MDRLGKRPLITNVTSVASEQLTGDSIQAGHPLFGLIWISPERVSGTPCFYGTRVPIKALFDSLAAGKRWRSFLTTSKALRESKPKRYWHWLDLTCRVPVYSVPESLERG